MASREQPSQGMTGLGGGRHHWPVTLRHGPVILAPLRQILNDAGGYSVRHPLFSEVELNQAEAAAERTVVEAAVV